MVDVIQRRCAVYTRNGSDGATLDQTETIRAFVDGNDLLTLAIPDAYSDHGVSGCSTEQPALAQAIADAEAGLFDVVLVSDLARLARDPVLLIKLVTRLEKSGVAVVAINDSFCSDSALHRRVFVTGNP